ncbi:hypothetical protein AC579_2308 [Pseudocercospora musae]|uniref:SMP-30/Gluconolactonase/LRE-like region domain-containing protein n=1 Tax=Pseudocercospora musae TaxID=113226 RepID=A0A139IVD5_9PEZI|nr:hypothetical protein AC579_2308 [Pseudocercospora musae]
MVNITYVDVLRLATSFDYADSLNSITNASTDHASLLACDQSLLDGVIGTNSTQKLIAELPFDAFHEGKIYATSNWAGSLDNPINITIVDPNTGDISFTRYVNVAEANGGAAFYPVGTPANSSEGQQIAFCDQGDVNHHGSQLTVVKPAIDETNNFLGRNFSSLNDKFGLELSIRPYVYRPEPKTGVIQAVTGSYIAPNGIEFSLDYKYVHITDTGAQTSKDGENNATYPATIYRFDITPDGKRLENRQTFAYSSVGLPDGIHTDIKGNVCSAVSRGIHAWDKECVF